MTTRALLLAFLALHAVSPAGAAPLPRARTPAAKPATPKSFANDIVPILTKAGCNSGGCHGSPSGRGGFRLSLFGYDPDADYASVVEEEKGRRIDRGRPEASLLLRKPTGQVSHGGGRRFAPGSPFHERLRGWIAAGSPRAPAFDPRVDALVVRPGSRLFLKRGITQPLAVTARFDDGTTRDVTALARYSSNDDLVARVDEAGVVTAGRPGETAIMVRYLGRVGVCLVTNPPPGPRPPPGAAPSLAGFRPRNVIDTHVLAKWRTLKLAPSPPATDGEFLRRATLDLTGLLPTAEEARRFLADRTADKRARLIDELLRRDAFIDTWTLKWDDLLRTNSRYLGEKGMRALHAWVRDRVAANAPLDQFARQLIASQGSHYRVGPAGFYQSSSRGAEEWATTTSQLFMGIRIGCARCHNHPFESWSQNDFYALAAFFARVRTKTGALEGETIVLSDFQGEQPHPKTGKPVDPAVPGGDPLAIEPEEDRRLAFASWLTAPSNRYFARAMANRIWAQFMGRGIVDPVDDMRVTNPPSNPALLDALAQELVRHRFDTRHLIRLILNSATYQLSARTHSSNAWDTSYFSHATPRRLTAEQLLDALSQVTGVPERFGPYPLGTRANQLPDARVGSYFLDLFGRPRREIVCECERTPDGSISQALQLINGDTLQRMLTAPDSALTRLAQSKRPAAELVGDLYLATLTRPPTRDEQQRAESLIAGAPTRREGLEDLLWALCNTREFMFNH